jgi:hypothetical protein
MFEQTIEIFQDLDPSVDLPEHTSLFKSLAFLPLRPEYSILCSIDTHLHLHALYNHQYLSFVYAFGEGMEAELNISDLGRSVDDDGRRAELVSQP